VALLRKMTCTLRHFMGLGHPLCACTCVLSDICVTTQCKGVRCSVTCDFTYVLRVHMYVVAWHVIIKGSCVCCSMPCDFTYVLRVHMYVVAWHVIIKGSYVCCSMTCDFTYVLRVPMYFTCVFTNSIVTNQFVDIYILRVHMYFVAWHVMLHMY